MQVIGIYNIKGGVGKTAAAVNLSYLSSRTIGKTLLWDLDPQGAATFYFQKKQGFESGTKKIIKGKSSLKESIKNTDYIYLDIVPSDFSFRNFDIILDNVKKSRTRLRDVIDEIKHDYDILILDCPPGISLLSENIFHAVDRLVVPIIPTILSVRTYHQITSFYLENELNEKDVVAFFSMAEIRKKMHRETMDELWLKEKRVCKFFIPYLSEIEKMGVTQKPVAAIRPKSRSAIAYRELWKELMTFYIKS
ncbi:MAG: ParA family protein [Brevinematales bacterium]|nr:ParA family protein [Brevinematales bacterium]